MPNQMTSSSIGGINDTIAGKASRDLPAEAVRESISDLRVPGRGSLTVDSVQLRKDIDPLWPTSVDKYIDDIHYARQSTRVARQQAPMLPDVSQHDDRTSPSAKPSLASELPAPRT